MRFAELLELRRVKQVPLAKRLRVTQPTVSRWVKEEMLPRSKIIPSLERILSAKCDWAAYSKGRLRFKAS